MINARKKRRSIQQIQKNEISPFTNHIMYANDIFSKHETKSRSKKIN